MQVKNPQHGANSTQHLTRHLNVTTLNAKKAMKEPRKRSSRQAIAGSNASRAT